MRAERPVVRAVAAMVLAHLLALRTTKIVVVDGHLGEAFVSISGEPGARLHNQASAVTAVAVSETKLAPMSSTRTVVSMPRNALAGPR